MRKTANNETRAQKAIRMINALNATWEEVAEAVSLAPKTIQRIVKEHYKTPKGYNNLLAKARANKKAKEQAEEIIRDSSVEEGTEKKVKEVIVTETGYLLDVGVNGILKESLDMYIPYFCIGELEKLSKSYKNAEEILTLFWSTRKITSINIRGKEVLYEDPIIPVKDRTEGVVAVCVELDRMGYKVRLLTNSREIEDLAKLQNCGIDVVRIKVR